MSRLHIALVYAVLALLLLISSSELEHAAAQTPRDHDGYQTFLPMLMRVGTSTQQPPPTQDDFVARELEVVRLTNLLRAENGCRVELKVVPELSQAARGHSQDMADQNYFSHTGKDESQPWDRMRRAGYTNFVAAAENIAASFKTPAEVVQGWKNSPGHYSNMLNCHYTEIGVGFAYNADSKYGEYWTQVFGRR